MASFVGWQGDDKPVWAYSDKTLKKKVRDVRWGDFLNVEEISPEGWARIKWGNERYFIANGAIVESRPLETIFVDVGQGDGCIVVLPETGETERILVIDAGEGPNMLALLNWRFKLNKATRPFHFHAAVITHPDQDHYKGFQSIFAHEKIRFDRVYHNGLMERATGDLLGEIADGYQTEVVVTQEQLEELYSDPAVAGRKQYPKLMLTALQSGRTGSVEMLGTVPGERRWMPGFAPADGHGYEIEVLGPLVQPDAEGRPRLKRFSSNDGKTKNGHSVILRLTMNGFSMLFGGDLNAPAEEHLLRHYGKIGPRKPLAAAVEAARKRLGADVMKCCHHGSSDVTDEFLQAVNPFAFVVSSGDEESHAHPRPDLLGRLGKNGRGSAPLILCTEIVRSTRERGKEEDFARLSALDAKIDDPRTAADERKLAQKERLALQRRIQHRNVGVYGAITMRTDGTRLQISFKIEAPRDKQSWQTYSFTRQGESWEPVGAAGQH